MQCAALLPDRYIHGVGGFGVDTLSQNRYKQQRITYTIIPQTVRALEGFLLSLTRIGPEIQDFSSPPTCLDLPSPAANNLKLRISHRRPLA